MVVDLGLDKTPREATEQKVGLYLSHYYDELDETRNDRFYGTEARRAYLGCFYLSTA